MMATLAAVAQTLMLLLPLLLPPVLLRVLMAIVKLASNLTSCSRPGLELSQFRHLLSELRGVFY